MSKRKKEEEAFANASFGSKCFRVNGVDQKETVEEEQGSSRYSNPNWHAMLRRCWSIQVHFLEVEVGTWMIVAVV